MGTGGCRVGILLRRQVGELDQLVEWSSEFAVDLRYLGHLGLCHISAIHYRSTIALG